MKLKTYNRKPKTIKAIQYDGTDEMAKELEKQGLCYLEYEEGGLIAYVLSNEEGTYNWNTRVNKGDWFVEDEETNTFIMFNEDFEREYITK